MNTAEFPRASLRSAIGMACNVVERRVSVPCLGAVKLMAHPEGGAVLRATDLDVQADIRIPDAIIGEGMATLIPAHQLKTLEAKAPASDAVSLGVTYGEATPPRKPGEAEGRTSDAIAPDFGKLRVKVDGPENIAAHEFPELRIEGGIRSEFEVPTAALLAAFQATEFAISTEETRYYLNGIYMHPRDGGLRFVATDGHRLACHDAAGIAAAGEWGVIVPRGTVEFLTKAMKAKNTAPTVRVIVNHTKVRFTLGHIDVISKLVYGTYPDYGRVIPTDSKTDAKCSRRDLMEAIKAVASVSDGKAQGMLLDFTGSRLTLTKNNPELGKAEMAIACEIIGEPLAIGFNGAYLLDILGAMSSDNVELLLNDPGAPARLRAPDSSTVYVLMPMRV